MKKMRVLAKVSLLALTFLMWSGTIFSQSKMPVESLTKDWSVFQEVKGIKFYAKEEIQSPDQYVLVKLENTTDKEITISYTLAVHYNLGCNGCNTEYLKTYSIPAMSSIEGNLSNYMPPLAMHITNNNPKNTYIPLYISTENLTIK
jgi:hypothetical protein